MNSRTTALVLGTVSLIIVALIIIFTTAAKPGPVCAQTGYDYIISISGSRPRPADISARLCDKLTFVNNDKVTREIAFGPHDNHIPYDGVAEKFLNKNQSFTVTLNKVGTYHWHDHLHDEVQGDFTVNK